jgi:hypothetical protein
MTLRRSLLLAAAVFALLGGLGAVLRYTPLAHGYLSGARRASESTLTPEGIAKRFHTAEGRCLRYATEAAPASELERAASAFMEAGFSSSQVAGLAGAFVRWEAEREAAIHALPEDEELLQLMGEGLPLAARPLFWLKRERLRESLKIPLDRIYAEGADALEALTPAQRTQVRAIWEAQPGALNLSGLIGLLRILRIQETRDRLEAVARMLEEQVRAGAPLPKSLTELSGLTPEARRDAWHNDFLYDPTIPGGVRVISLGEDGSAGGSGPDADLARDVMLAPEPTKEVPPSDEPSPQVKCGPLPAVAVVSRAEYDRTYEDLNGLARTARIVPAFEKGQAYGFKLFSIQPGSPLARAGLCNGDVVMAMAGLPLTSPENALQLYSRLKGAREVKLEIRRKGKDAGLTLRIR